MRFNRPNFLQNAGLASAFALVAFLFQPARSKLSFASQRIHTATIVWEATSSVHITFNVYTAATQSGESIESITNFAHV